MIDGYDQLEVIGPDGYSIVYRARQISPERDVAVKVLAVDFDGDRTEARFRRECNATARFTGHPNIITVLDSGRTRMGHPHLTLPYCPDGSLADRLQIERGEIMRCAGLYNSIISACRDQRDAEALEAMKQRRPGREGVPGVRGQRAVVPASPPTRRRPAPGRPATELTDSTARGLASARRKRHLGRQAVSQRHEGSSRDDQPGALHRAGGAR